MKNVLLGILLTGVAAFIGMMCGFLIAALIGAATYSPPQTAGGVRKPPIIIALMAGLPTVGALCGVAIGWIVLLKMKNQAYLQRHCGVCGYDLHLLASEHCPECGALIPAWQKRELSKTEQNHA